MNTEKQLQLVTFEQAKALKELGFDWEVPSFYFFGDGRVPELIIKDKSELKGYKGWKSWYYWEATQSCRISAPTVALALKWCRDVKGYRYAIDDGMSDPMSCTGYSFKFNGKYSKSSYPTIEAAESALLDEIIEYLKSQEK